MKCGREPGGINELTLGVCFVPLLEKADGLNNGKNAGRVCWAVAGTLCGCEITGVFAKKLNSCLTCEFYKLVTTEEGFDFVPTKEISKILKD